MLVEERSEGKTRDFLEKLEASDHGLSGSWIVTWVGNRNLTYRGNVSMYRERVSLPGKEESRAKER